MIPVLTSFFQSCMKRINFLMKGLISVEYFLISPRGLIECGVKVLCSNFKKKAFLVNYSLLLWKGFLKSRKQRVALNGQHYSWKDVNASIQGPILGAFCFLIYIYNMSYGLTFTPKPFTDVTSLFSVIHDVIFSQIDLTLSAAGGKHIVHTSPAGFSTAVF